MMRCPSHNSCITRTMPIARESRRGVIQDDHAAKQHLKPRRTCGITAEVANQITFGGSQRHQSERHVHNAITAFPIARTQHTAASS